MTSSSINVAKKALLAQLATNHDVQSMNEAETRFFVIDEVIRSVGWRKSDHRIEKYFNGGYTDYELGSPGKLVVEAKRAGKHFDIAYSQQRDRRVQDLMALDETLDATVRQTQKYCSERGIPLGLCTNGTQYVFFSRLDLMERRLLKGTPRFFTLWRM